MSDWTLLPNPWRSTPCTTDRAGRLPDAAGLCIVHTDAVSNNAESIRFWTAFMWFFGHLGFTLAAAAVAEAALLRPKSSGDLATTERATALAGGSDSHGQGFVKRWVTGGPARLGQGFDYRLVAISSLLPDVDKPISLLLLGTFDRGYLHTALAWFLLIAAAVWLFRAEDTRLLQVAFGWSLHM